jgi:hypothetical protein
VTSPDANVVAPKAAGRVTVKMRRFSARTTPRSYDSSWIGLTPPGTLRNCHDGFTWNGRTARNSVTSRAALEGLVTR